MGGEEGKEGEEGEEREEGGVGTREEKRGGERRRGSDWGYNTFTRLRLLNASCASLQVGEWLCNAISIVLTL